MKPSCVFVYSNLKVSPFLPYDAPLPGFDLITYDKESFTFGTLWDIGHDAGYTSIGQGFVYGQVWKYSSQNSLEELKELVGVSRGLTEEKVVDVVIDIDDIKTNIQALTFSLTKIQKEYIIIQDGNWLIKRSKI